MAGEAGRLTCYSCGHSYDYLGAGSHPGVCPDCGGREVSPAGALDIDTAEAIEIESDIEISAEYCRIFGHDDSGREFQWWFAVDGDGDGSDSAFLVRVLIESTAVSAENVVGSDLVPLQRLHRRLDVEVCDPRPVEQTHDEHY